MVFRTGSQKELPVPVTRAQAARSRNQDLVPKQIGEKQASARMTETTETDRNQPKTASPPGESTQSRMC